jgi:hypothetical protein
VAWVLRNFGSFGNADFADDAAHQDADWADFFLGGNAKNKKASNSVKN